MKLTVMRTPPPFFGPKVRPNGLSTSTSMFFEAPAVLAVITSPPLFTELLLFLTERSKELETPLLAS